MREDLNNIILFKVIRFNYPASRSFFLENLLAFTKPFASLVFRVVGLFTSRLSEMRETQMTSYMLFTCRKKNPANRVCSTVGGHHLVGYKQFRKSYSGGSTPRSKP